MFLAASIKLSAFLIVSSEKRPFKADVVSGAVFINSDPAPISLPPTRPV